MTMEMNILINKLVIINILNIRCDINVIFCYGYLQVILLLNLTDKNRWTGFEPATIDHLPLKADFNNLKLLLLNS